jgi:hypothetical protein
VRIGHHINQTTTLGSNDLGIGLPVNSETFIKNLSVHSKPIGIFDFGACDAKCLDVFFGFFQLPRLQQHGIDAFGASLISSW